MIVGYTRVSSFEQNASRQLENQKIEKLFADVVSGKNTERPQLQALLEFVREGDVVLVHSMDRLARNLDDLRLLVKTLTNKGIHIQLIQENIVFTGEDSPMSQLLLSVMGAFAEFERALIKERQREGIALAKKRGVYKGRKQALDREQILQLKERIKAGEAKSTVAKEFGICRATLYQYLKQNQ